MSDPRIEAAARAAWIDSRNGDIGYGWDAAPEMIRKYWRRRVVPVLAGADEVDPARAALPIDTSRWRCCPLCGGDWVRFCRWEWCEYHTTTPRHSGRAFKEGSVDGGSS